MSDRRTADCPDCLHGHEVEPDPTTGEPLSVGPCRRCGGTGEVCSTCKGTGIDYDIAVSEPRGGFTFEVMYDPCPDCYEPATRDQPSGGGGAA